MKKHTRMLSIDYNSGQILASRKPSLIQMNYPNDVFFDIETLVNVSQAQSILVLGNCQPGFLDNYIQQKALLNQDCQLRHIKCDEIESLWQLKQRFDVAIVVDLFEHIEKNKGMQVLSRLRDVLSPQYCICLPLSNSVNSESWHLTDLFSFALSRVSSYRVELEDKAIELGLFKYNINDYKKTPDWLNADNWANPQMWGKYWW